MLSPDDVTIAVRAALKAAFPIALTVEEIHEACPGARIGQVRGSLRRLCDARASIRRLDCSPVRWVHGSVKSVAVIPAPPRPEPPLPLAALDPPPAAQPAAPARRPMPDRLGPRSVFDFAHWMQG